MRFDDLKLMPLLLQNVQAAGYETPNPIQQATIPLVLAGKDVLGCAQTGTSGTTNAGTQQVSSGSGSAVYHTVKKGDTVWALVNKKYKYLGKSESWVINNNPKAFSRKGDARTLQIGRKLLMGYKK